MSKIKIVIVGGGAAGIMLACHLDTELYDVTLVEQTSRLGRKLLVAGEGGFNLTFDEPLEDMISKYLPSGFLDKAIQSFTNQDLRNWLASIGIETYVGSSRRVFPVKGIKPYEVVAAMTARLEEKGVKVLTSTKWCGWASDSSILIENDAGPATMEYDRLVLALGGASWSKTGSDGSWTSILRSEGVRITDFQPSNCAWKVVWPEAILQSIEGNPLKNIALRVGKFSVKGEALITSEGLEGGAIYAAAWAIRQEISASGSALLQIDLKPDVTKEEIRKTLEKRSKSVKHCLLHQIKLSPTAVEILRHMITKEDYHNPTLLAKHIKSLSIATSEPGHIDKAISTAGGVALDQIGEYYMLDSKPSIYVIGEMLDWDTRTGGYLLQGCFSMAVHLAKHFTQTATK